MSRSQVGPEHLGVGTDWRQSGKWSLDTFFLEYFYFYFLNHIGIQGGYFKHFKLFLASTGAQGMLMSVCLSMCAKLV